MGTQRGEHHTRTDGMPDAVRELPPAPLWARALFFLFRTSSRLIATLLRIAWPLVCIAADYVSRSASRLFRFLANRAPRAYTFFRRVSGRLLRNLWHRGVLPFARLGWLPLLRGILLPAGLGTVVIAGALLLQQVDAPASPTAIPKENKRNLILATTDPFHQATPTLDEAKLKVLRGDLIGSDVKRRDAALKRILAATAEDAPLLHRSLLRKTGIPASNYKTFFRRLGALVPDHRGRFASGAKAAKSKDLDWLTAILSKDPANLSPRLRKARDEGLYSMALARALITTKRPEVATTLLRFAYRHEGAFRDACGRMLRILGDAALPGLVRAGLIADPLAYRMVRYAGYQLDRMNRSRPDLALRKTIEPSLRAELLHAYGEARTTSAVNAVVRYTGSAHGHVRRAARWATLRYASGRKPKAHKRRLKLAGGHETQRARSLYYTYRQLVHYQLARTYAALQAKLKKGPLPSDELLKRLKTENDARGLAEKLFSLQDATRSTAKHRRLTRAMARATKGEFALAVNTFDRVLAKGEAGSERGMIAKIYLSLGRRELRQGHYQRAALAITKALLILPKNAPQRRRAQALRLVAEARRDGAFAARWRLRRALTYDTTLESARRSLEKLDRQQDRSLIIITTVAGLAGIGLVLLLFGLRRRKSARK